MAADAPRTSPVPVLYRAPVPVTPERHGTKSLKGETTYAFAAGINSVPINGPEFPAVGRLYPIVFTTGAPRSAVAVFGLRPNQNLFVDERGAWRDGAYIPAYVRRFPFIFIEGLQPGQFVLGIEESSGLLVDGTERPLFADGKPSQLAEHAMRFCTEFQNHHAATEPMIAELERLDLLVENRAEAVIPGGERMVLSGFRIVDENRLGKLADEDFLNLRRRNWLGWIYCHLISLGNWAVLGSLAARPQSGGTA